MFLIFSSCSQKVPKEDCLVQNVKECKLLLLLLLL